MLVEIDTSVNPIEVFDVKLPSGTTYAQYVSYENLPKFYNFCYMFGHLRDKCKHHHPKEDVGQNKAVPEKHVSDEGVNPMSKVNETVGGSLNPTVDNQQANLQDEGMNHENTNPHECSLEQNLNSLPKDVSHFEDVILPEKQSTLKASLDEQNTSQSVNVTPFTSISESALLVSATTSLSVA